MRNAQKSAGKAAALRSEGTFSLSSVHNQHFPRSDVEFGMRAGGAAAYGGRVCANTVHIVCRCVVIRGGAPKEWGRHRSHDMSGMVTVLLFFLPFSSLMTVSCIIAPV